MTSLDNAPMCFSVETLVEQRVASRIHAKDATLYDFSAEAQACAENYMGWTDLPTNPPYPLEDIQAFADRVIADGIEAVVLIGQGGSTQAPMTITKYNKIDKNRVDFRTLDSDSPVRVREIMATIRPEHTLIIIASKSGSTIEPRIMLAVMREEFAQFMPAEQVTKHLVAITDPGSDLEKQAKEEGWLAVFPGEPSVGGRFSALSVFGLLPAALAGIDICAFLACATKAEELCAQDSPDNPAIKLVSFLYDGYAQGRNKFAFLTPKRGRVFGLWIEQLVAESLGKDGKGILPNIEIDPLTLCEDPGDRVVIMYQTHTDLWDESRNFEMGLSYVDPAIPSMSYRIDSAEELAAHFLIWEYAIAMCGFLMKVCPFDQPDVASAKAATAEIFSNGQPAAHIEHDFTDDVLMGTVEVRVAPQFEACGDLYEVMYALLGSIEPGDYFSLNAFLPFTGEGRREVLETIRHIVSSMFGVASCLEVGPRYLHSTGQLHKGGANNGVFLILSADELKDISIPQSSETLGSLAKAQAMGDLVTLAERGRRCAHVHLPDNSAATLRRFTSVVHEAAEEVLVERLLDRTVRAQAGDEQREDA